MHVTCVRRQRFFVGEAEHPRSYGTAGSAARKSCSLPLLNTIARPWRAERNALRKVFTSRIVVEILAARSMKFLCLRCRNLSITLILLGSLSLINTRIMAESTPQTDTGAFWRSAIAPGWGQFYKGRSSWGYLYSIGFGVSTITTVTVSLIWQQKKTNYINYQPTIPAIYPPPADTGAASAELDRLYNVSKTWEHITLVSAIITLSTYTFCLLDAYFGKASPSKDATKADSSSTLQPLEFSVTGGSGASLTYKHPF